MGCERKDWIEPMRMATSSISCNTLLIPGSHWRQRRTLWSGIEGRRKATPICKNKDNPPSKIYRLLYPDHTHTRKALSFRRCLHLTVEERRHWNVLLHIEPITVNILCMEGNSIKSSSTPSAEPPKRELASLYPADRQSAIQGRTDSYLNMLFLKTFIPC